MPTFRSAQPATLFAWTETRWLGGPVWWNLNECGPRRRRLSLLGYSLFEPVTPVKGVRVPQLYIIRSPHLAPGKMASSPPASPGTLPQRPLSAMVRPAPRSNSRMSVHSKAGGGSRASDEDGRTSVKVGECIVTLGWCRRDPEPLVPRCRVFVSDKVL